LELGESEHWQALVSLLPDPVSSRSIQIPKLAGQNGQIVTGVDIRQITPRRCERRRVRIDPRLSRFPLDQRV
jgi:hypothetical protein